MGVTTAKCFICGQGATVQFHFQCKGNNGEEQLLDQWRKKWSMSLCRVLQLSGSFESIFDEASFCFNCQEAVCRAEFTVNAISRLQKEIGVIREELKGNFQLHYENLMQERTELDATGNEYKSIEDIIMEIAVSLEPVEEAVDHFLEVDNLEDCDIVVPGMNLHKDEFPRLELLDHLENSEDSLESNIPLSDFDNSVVSPIPSLSKQSGMRQQQHLVTRSITSRVNFKETLENSSDSGNDLAKPEDLDFSAIEMAEDENEVGGSLIITSKASPYTPDHQKPNCYRCGKEFNSRRHVQLHLKLCSGRKKVHEKSISQKVVQENISNSTKGVGKNKPFKCPQCPDQYARLATLRNHIKSVHVAGSSSPLVLPNHKWVLNCSICLKGFDEESTLKEHEILHVPETPHACVLCSEQNLNSAANLRRHVQSAHDGKKYWCNMEPCLSSFVAFNRVRAMRSHFTSEHSEEDNQRIYHCTECASKFTNSSRLLVHSRTHNTIRSYLCVICGKTFRTEVVLKQHERSFHSELRMKPKCSLCMKSFEGAAEVDEHEKLHLKETPFNCVLCEKMLLSTIELQRHVAASHELLQFECPVEGCDAKFATKSKLVYHHIKTHADKRFQCPHCPVRFYAPSLLKTHLVGHSQERTHSCPITGCGGKFKNEYSLKKHMMNMHEPGARKKKFECRLCGKCYPDRQKLSLHEVTHGDARPFTCDICSATFKAKQILKTHLKRHEKTSGRNRQLRVPRKTRIPQTHM